jgi:hypothetical protein
MIIRRLTVKGIKRFEEFLDFLTTDSPQEAPMEILTDPEFSESIEPPIEVENRKFTNRFDAAEYLYMLFADTGVSELDKDKGLWSWLSLFFFKQLCSADRDGHLKPGEHARWIPAIDDYRKYYRHLLAGPFRIYRSHRNNPPKAMVLLCGPVDRPGDIVEQLASRQEIVTNKSIIEIATNLYVDPKTLRYRKGAGGKGPGSARRLTEVLNQFDVTWDLYAMVPSDFINMLPREFSKFGLKK